MILTLAHTTRLIALQSILRQTKSHDMTSKSAPEMENHDTWAATGLESMPRSFLDEEYAMLGMPDEPKLESPELISRLKQATSLAHLLHLVASCCILLQEMLVPSELHELLVPSESSDSSEWYSGLSWMSKSFRNDTRCWFGRNSLWRSCWRNAKIDSCRCSTQWSFAKRTIALPETSRIHHRNCYSTDAQEHRFVPGMSLVRDFLISMIV